ncbi:MAG: DEAD/DEAH box helicase, partial [Lachnospiraceae bacterium]|nr:DEAD/DEAH box helicase [Lachnospiraceae bacterium]
MIETADIRTIKGVGDKTASLYNKVGIYSVYDALTYFPRDYDRYSPPVPIADIRQTMTQGNSEFHTVAGTVFGSVRQKRVRHLTITNLSIKDASGVLHLTYFNMPFLSKVLKSGSYYIFRGRVEKKGDELHMEQAKMFKEPEYQVLINTFRPRYPLTAGLSNNTLIKTVAQILNNFTFPTDHLPPAVKKNHNLIDYQTAIKKIHFPADYDDLAEARRRLVFDEFFLFIIAVRRMRDTSQAKRSSAIMLEVAETERLLEALPYRLTNAQLKVWSEITADLSGQYVMNRLIQGDVGSGKTIIAFLALLMCAANGCQGAMMAPTEVLAAQHYKALKELSDQYNLPIRPIILTGAMSAAAKREAYAKILSGEANVIIGTHALIQEKVNYKNLALVITDEQHRFGVRQRESLAGKGR